MKLQKVSLVVLGAAILSACGGSQTAEKTTTEPKEAKTEVKEEPESAMSEAQKAEEIAMLDAMREEAEKKAASIEPEELSTASMRAQVKQKWSKIHFYTENGTVFRIKTYPHEGISKRTEEFYFKNGELRLAVVEDDGSGEKGKEKAQLTKLYYYKDGAVIAEVNNSGEAEYSIRNSDGERLLQEANEYLEVYKK